MEEEMRALEKNGTWDVVDLSIDKETVGCKWFFTQTKIKWKCGQVQS